MRRSLPYRDRIPRRADALANLVSGGLQVLLDRGKNDRLVDRLHYIDTLLSQERRADRRPPLLSFYRLKNPFRRSHCSRCCSRRSPKGCRSRKLLPAPCRKRVGPNRNARAAPWRRHADRSSNRPQSDLRWGDEGFAPLTLSTVALRDAAVPHQRERRGTLPRSDRPGLFNRREP